MAALPQHVPNAVVAVAQGAPAIPATGSPGMYGILYLYALFMVQIWPSLAFSTCRRAGSVTKEDVQNVKLLGWNSALTACQKSS